MQTMKIIFYFFSKPKTSTDSSGNMYLYCLLQAFLCSIDYLINKSPIPAIEILLSFIICHTLHGLVSSCFNKCQPNYKITCIWLCVFSTLSIQLLYREYSMMILTESWFLSWLTCRLRSDFQLCLLFVKSNTVTADNAILYDTPTMVHLFIILIK